MARKKDSAAALGQMEFNLRAVERLRRGLLADGLEDDALVARADAVIAEYRERIRKARG